MDFNIKHSASFLIGIDEVGRGCWAGPLVVGAVILDKNIPGLTDSKCLNVKMREQLAGEIKKKAKHVSLGWVSSKEVDSLGLTNATKLGINRAIKDIKNYEQIIIDGNINYLPNNPKAISLIKADLHIPAVSAASIVAKVARDEYMKKLSSAFPEYGFDKHVGYGTKLHKVALLNHGITTHHRKSFKPIGIFCGEA